MISALAFVPKGKALHVPHRDVPGEAELEALRDEALQTGALEDEMAENDDDSDWATDSDEDEDIAVKHFYILSNEKVQFIAATAFIHAENGVRIFSGGYNSSIITLAI